MELTPFLFGLYKFAKFALYPLSWVILLLVLLTLLTLLPASPQRHRWIRRLALSSLFLLCVIASPITARVLNAGLESWFPDFDRSTSQRFDAIVVLAGGVYSQGTLRPANDLSDYSRHRTTCGADLFREGFAPKLLLSGGDAAIVGAGPMESQIMKQWALRLGIPNEAILTEERSRTTYENAVETKKILGNASILLVSSAGHLPRAVALFRKQGLQATPFPCGFIVKDRPGDGWTELTLFDFIPQTEALRRTTGAIDEYAGLLVYWLAGKL